jgi:hypothetical protein
MNGLSRRLLFKHQMPLILIASRCTETPKGGSESLTTLAHNEGRYFYFNLVRLFQLSTSGRAKKF